MLKELQDKIKLEVDRMEKKLFEIISAALNEKDIVTKVSEDLSVVNVFINKNKDEQDGRVVQNYYGFALTLTESGEVNKVFSSDSNVILLSNAKVVGTYSVPTTIELQTLNLVFKLIEDFRNEELSTEAAPAE
jgi:DNA-directed RNA polymerase subunit E'/Rpb7